MNYYLALLHHRTTEQHATFAPWQWFSVNFQTIFSEPKLHFPKCFSSCCLCRPVPKLCCRDTEHPLSPLFSPEDANPCWFPCLKRTFKQISSTRPGFCLNITHSTQISQLPPQKPASCQLQSIILVIEPYGSGRTCFTHLSHSARARSLQKLASDDKPPQDQPPHRFLLDHNQYQPD